MGHTLVGADDLVPDLAFVGVIRRSINGVARDAVVDSRHGDALGIQSDKDLAEPVSFDTDQRFRTQLYSIEEQHELLVRRHHHVLDGSHRNPSSVGRYDEERKWEPSVRFGDRTSGHDEDGVRLVHGGRPVLAAIELPTVPGRGRRGADAMGVRPGIGLGDRKRHSHRTVGQPWQPPLLQFVAAEALDDRRADRLQHHREQRTPLCGSLLDDDVVLGDPAAAATPAFGDVGTEETGLAEFSPQLGDLAPGAHLVLEVLTPVFADQLGDALAQLQMVFRRVDQVRVRQRLAGHG